MSTSGFVGGHVTDFDEISFRSEVREFLRTHWLEVRDGRPDDLSFRRSAVAGGYIWRHIPRCYGGAEQPPHPLKALIIKEEFRRAGAPSEYPFRTVQLVVDTLLVAGEPWQKETFVENSLTGEYVWCQGYSEPEAGSDVAALRTKAELRGDQWVIKGQKVWTSLAHMSTHMLLLARTEPEAPKHEGISCLLVEMKQPGITVRPLKMITGEAHFNEVFLDDAVTSADWIVGRRGDGWAVTRKTLNFERASVGSASTSEDLFEKLVKLANVATLHGKPAIKDPLIRDELTRIYGMVSAHKAEDLDQIYLLRQGEESRPANAALHKLYNSTIAERIGQLSQRIINTAAMGAPTEDARGPVRWVSQYMNSIAAQIGGGTSNIQRNIIAERALGLPRDN